jgi:hypothetical protein
MFPEAYKLKCKYYEYLEELEFQKAEYVRHIMEGMKKIRT